MSEQIFRPASLERLASPEQLDQLTQITPARAWATLTALGLIVTAALVWGIAGRIPDRVVGRGILVRAGGVLEVVAISGGQIVDVAVRPGDPVQAGQVIARLGQPELVRRIDEARIELENARESHRQLLAYHERDVRLQLEYLDQQAATTRSTMASAEEGIARLAEQAANQEELVREGLLTRQTPLGTRRALEEARAMVTRERNELTRLEAQRIGLLDQRRRAELESELRLEFAARSLAALEGELRSASEVVSSYSGRILEVMIEAGRVVNRGEPLVSLNRVGQSADLEAILYVPALHGKKVRSGMPVHLAPSTVRREEHGLMLGTVIYVSDHPATPRGMMRALKNEQLVQAMSGDGAPYEVLVELQVDPGTVSRFRWSSSAGPPLEIHGGTLFEGTITVGERRPLEFVVPMFRRVSGLS